VIVQGSWEHLGGRREKVVVDPKEVLRNRPQVLTALSTIAPTTLVRSPVCGLVPTAFSQLSPLFPQASQFSQLSPLFQGMRVDADGPEARMLNSIFYKPPRSRTERDISKLYLAVPARK